jgi:hypothetical protein
LTARTSQFDPTQTSAQRISVRKMFEFLYLFLCPVVGCWPK